MRHPHLTIPIAGARWAGLAPSFLHVSAIDNNPFVGKRENQKEENRQSNREAALCVYHFATRGRDLDCRLERESKTKSLLALFFHVKSIMVLICAKDGEG